MSSLTSLPVSLETSWAIPNQTEIYLKNFLTTFKLAQAGGVGKLKTYIIHHLHLVSMKVFRCFSSYVNTMCPN